MHRPPPRPPSDRHISARTLDFAHEVQPRVQVVPRGQKWSATPTRTYVAALEWTNDLGFVGMDAFGFDSHFCDGLNEAGLSIGTLRLPESDLTTTAPESGSTPAIDSVNLAGWLLGTSDRCRCQGGPVGCQHLECRHRATVASRQGGSGAVAAHEQALGIGHDHPIDRLGPDGKTQGAICPNGSLCARRSP